MRGLAIAAVAVVVVLLVVRLVVLLASREPGRIGPVDGALAPCPAKPNCVSSQATDDHRIEPLRWPSPASMPPLEQIVTRIDREPRTRVIVRTEDYARVEFRSLVFGFVDDLELLARPVEGRIEVRSASRLGHGDLGANRRRVERIRGILRAELGAAG